jgi:hypothetical protein
MNVRAFQAAAYSYFKPPKPEPDPPPYFQIRSMALDRLSLVALNPQPLPPGPPDPTKLTNLSLGKAYRLMA